MQYIHLSNDSYILSTTKGLVTLTRKMINFNRIKRLINKDAEEKHILPLLETQKLPNGVFELYHHKDTDTMIIKHITNGGSCNWSALNNQQYVSKTPNSPFTFNVKHTSFIGVYVSIPDIMVDFPEYCL